MRAEWRGRARWSGGGLARRNCEWRMLDGSACLSLALWHLMLELRGVPEGGSARIFGGSVVSWESRWVIVVVALREAQVSRL